MTVIAFLLLSLTFWHETNSHASAARGVKAYEKKEYAKSAEAFARATELAPGPRSSFNLGTARVAAGQRQEGSADLAAAMQDPALRADAYYNRGNSALASKALDHAIRDYVDALKANPQHAAAKRNLEIALQRREEQRKNASANGDKQQQGESPQQPSPSGGKKEPKPGEIDLDALLRSVQQQELDEMRRMKGKANAEGRVGW